MHIQKRISGLEYHLMYVSMFQCSSIAYQLICVLFMASGIFLLDLQLLVVDDQSQFVDNLVQIPGFMLMSFVIWYILQRRELKSFIRERRALLKQEQLTGLFDSQGDAIVVVKVQPEPDQEQQLDQRQGISDSVIFCNQKSTQLFGSDLRVEEGQQQGVKGFLPLSQLEISRQGQRPSVGFNSLLATEQNLQKLHSLAEILSKSPLENKLVQEEGQTEVEMYKMVTVEEDKIGQLISPDSIYTGQREAKTIVVNRRLLNFNEQECCVINFTDISAYEELKKQHEAYNLLKRLNAQVHHEMLVPLRVNVEMAQRLLRGNTTEIQKRLIQNIYVSSNMVMNHAHDFLDKQLIEKGVFVPHYRPTSLAKIVVETISIIEITLEGRDLQIIYNLQQLKTLPKVKLDQRRFQQVLLNVLNNATKFQDKGQINVEVICTRSQQPDAKQVVVGVTDQGIGMTDQQLQTIFTPFNESRQREQYGGNGVGLSMCKAICDSLGGHIEAYSELGQGTKITFSQMCYEYINSKKAKGEVTCSVLNTISERSSENGDKIQGQDSELPIQLQSTDVDKNGLSRPIGFSQQSQSQIAGQTNQVASSNNAPLGLENDQKNDGKRVTFQGLDILIDTLKPEPYSTQSSPQPSIDSNSQRLLEFLNANKAVYSSPNTGTIVAVDDQFVSQQLLLLKIRELGTTNEIVMLSNGKQACNFVECVLNETVTPETSVQQPIPLLLIDINMPIMTGMEAVKIIRQMYERLNKDRSEQGKGQVVRPAILYYSQQSRKQMQVFIKEDEQADFYLEKPVPSREIRALLALLNIPVRAQQT